MYQYITSPIKKWMLHLHLQDDEFRILQRIQINWGRRENVVDVSENKCYLLYMTNFG